MLKMMTNGSGKNNGKKKIPDLNETVQKLSSTEMTQKLQQYREDGQMGEQLKVKSFVFLVTSVILFLINIMFSTNEIIKLIVIGLSFIIFVIFILMFFSGELTIDEAKRNIKEIISKNLILLAIDEVFEDSTYQMDGHIGDDIIKASNMIPYAWDEVRGNDHIKAKYQGLNIEMSDIELYEIVKTEDADGNTDYNYKKNFNGLWLICDFGRELVSDLLLQERFDGKGIKNNIHGSLKLTMTQKSDIKVDNEEFNKKFVIRSKTPHDIFYILTPHMMEYILKMDRQSNGRTFMRFTKEGKVHIAIDSLRNAFEVDLNQDTDLEIMKQKYIDEIRYVINIIDELCLVDTLYG